MDVDRKESTDLLRPKQRQEANGRKASVWQESGGPPDGGLRAYIVVIASFCTNGLIFGIINSYSVIYLVLLKRLESQNVDGATVKASLCGVLTIGCTFAISPVSGILSNFLGLRTTTMVGGIIATIGLALSSFFVDNIDVLCVTYGIIYGLGASLAYTPSLAILGHYFKKKLGIVNGVVTIGSSVFTVSLPPLMEYMINNYGLSGMFRVLAVFGFGIFLCGILFKPVAITKPVNTKKGAWPLLRIIMGVELWKKRRYTLWALIMPVALFGYFVPYVHIKKYIEDLNFENDINMNLPLQGLAVTSAIGRLIFGYLSDRPRVNKIMIQQIMFYTIGTLTIMLAFAKAFWVIAFELCGCKHAAEGIGCMLGLAAYPLCFGPPLAAHLYSTTLTYTLPFILSGITPIVGASLMFLIYFQKRKPNQTETNGHAISLERA
ncbi:monocarboxylate transporter 10 isoform X2 [Hyposmocoma kahamanoa]|uniref:monocarboxylate transporter 10 isoform X2 n=1 Tax=Hyposmocoma kahamanoa TaxID=1477025 RepID=UPI000E6D64CE|nr:monocarboxylate transporter 10 isoform X2 [Hyposmocoma kahamanoa]